MEESFFMLLLAHKSGSLMSCAAAIHRASENFELHPILVLLLLYNSGHNLSWANIFLLTHTQSKTACCFNKDSCDIVESSVESMFFSRKRRRGEITITVFLILFVQNTWKKMITSECLLFLQGLELKNYVPSKMQLTLETHECKVICMHRAMHAVYSCHS